ncbi:MFS transporter [Paraburkholderia sp. Ac-20340]|uniref:MFS transporter n=1 Tax=Paraburkholderia sp. Ac-20340 TaxID=2703888 RepID=UPI001981ED96|nr:MFS transporter [Paraburkholderia sp. Ac-20340]MBN3857932.1 MFS transporter [Paraburkholderia sp. Ac-20340]
MKTTLEPHEGAALDATRYSGWTLMSIIILGAVISLPGLIAPALAVQLAQQLGLSASQIGAYFFIELMAFSSAALPAQFWMGRFDERRVARVAAVVFVVANCVTAGMPFHLGELLALRFVAGLAGGTLGLLCMTSAGMSPNPDRAFGLWIVGQLVAGAIGLYFLPQLFAVFGLKSLFLCVAALTTLALPLCGAFSSRLTKPVRRPRGAGRVRQAGAPGRDGRFALLVVSAVCVFYLAIGAVWSFSSRAAAGAGLDPILSGKILSIATLMGIAGAMTASVIGGRGSRRLILGLGYGLLIAALVGLCTGPHLAGYAVSVFAFKFAWTFVIPFVFAVAAKEDASGRLTSAVGFITGVALAVGPLVAGVLLDRGVSYGALCGGAAVLCAISFLCMLLANRRLAGAA